jgi:hypothetical protein
MRPEPLIGSRFADIAPPSPQPSPSPRERESSKPSLSSGGEGVVEILPVEFGRGVVEILPVEFGRRSRRNPPR